MNANKLIRYKRMQKAAPFINPKGYATCIECGESLRSKHAKPRKCDECLAGDELIRERTQNDRIRASNRYDG